MAEVRIGMAVEANASFSVRGIKVGRQLEEQGRIVEPDGTILSLDDILAAWKVPTSSFSIEACRVPAQVMVDLKRDAHVLHRVDPRQFEHVVAEILDKRGFKDVTVTPRSKDGGRDVTAYQVVSGISIHFFVECKQHKPENPVSMPELWALLGTVQDAREATMGVLVTTSRFTKDGREFIAQRGKIDGKDFNDLSTWIGELKSP